MWILLPSFTRQKNSILQRHRNSMRCHFQMHTWQGYVRLRSNQRTFPLFALTSISAFAGKLLATAWTLGVCSKQTSGFRQQTKWASASPAAGHPHYTQQPRQQPLLPALWSALHSICFKSYLNVTKRQSHSTRSRNISCYFNVRVNWNRAEGHSQGCEDLRAFTESRLSSVPEQFFVLIHSSS